MNKQEQKEWIKKRFTLLDGKTLAKALQHYWLNREVKIETPKTGYEMAKEIFNET